MISRRTILLVSLTALLPVLRARADETASAVGKKLFLWKVSSGQGEVYLLGAMHFAKKDLYPLPKEIEEAFERSKVLVLELRGKDSDKIQRFVKEKGNYERGDSIFDHVSPEAAAKLKEKIGKGELQEDQIQRLKPWLLAATLSVHELRKLGYDGEGIDEHFRARAAERSMEILELESIEFQLSLVADMPDKLQSQNLLSALEEIEVLPKMMERIVSAWEKGDDKELAKILFSEPLAKHAERARLRARMFDERNAKMVEKIEEYLEREGPYFVAVGAGHLVGQQGILNLLERKKYRIEQLERR